MVMESNLSGADFGFAFNDANFSDRLLHIEITGSGEVSCSSEVTLGKRKREDSNKESSIDGVLDINSYPVASTNLNKKNKKDEEAVLLGGEETQSGGDYDNESDLKLNIPLVIRVKELHISSAVLAAKSPFFYKLFSNGMRESEQQHVTLTIDASVIVILKKEVAVMELLNFMYTNSLSVTTAAALLEVLIAADKYEVALCMKHCSSLLLNMPMTQDFALILLELPSSIQAAESVEPLKNAARQFFATRYRDVSKSLEAEMMALPLAGLEAIIASDDLQLVSEDVVYDLVIKWVQRQYSVESERQKILGSHLARFIRFPQMKYSKLHNILASEEFTHPVKKDLILEALFFKGQSSLVTKQLDSKCGRFVERAYDLIPIKTVKFETPRQQCIVYLELTRKECEGLYPSNMVNSQAFSLGGQSFYLSVRCNTETENMLPRFGLFFGLQASGTTSPTVEFEFSARSKPKEEFVKKFKDKENFLGEDTYLVGYVFAMPWESFMAETSPYFINDVLHLRAALTICP